MDKNYEKSRQKAIAFLKKPADKLDFNEALGILEEAGYKPIYINKLRQAGEDADTRAAVIKNVYALIRQWAKPESIEHEDEMESQAPEPDAAEVEKMEAIYSDNQSEAGQLIRQFADLYKTREKLHRELSSVGEHNDEKSVARRKEIVVSIAAISRQMDEIYPLIAEFQATGTLPESKENLHIDNKDLLSEGESVTDKGPSSLSSMGVEELKVYKKNLATRIRRTRNKIEYRQENASGAKPNPLPQGSPRRIRLEVRISKLEKEMQNVELEIAKFG